MNPRADAAGRKAIERRIMRALVADMFASGLAMVGVVVVMCSGVVCAVVISGDARDELAIELYDKCRMAKYDVSKKITVIYRAFRCNCNGLSSFKHRCVIDC